MLSFFVCYRTISYGWINRLLQCIAIKGNEAKSWMNTMKSMKQRKKGKRWKQRRAELRKSKRLLFTGSSEWISKMSASSVTREFGDECSGKGNCVIVMIFVSEEKKSKAFLRNVELNGKSVYNDLLAVGHGKWRKMQESLHVLYKLASKLKMIIGEYKIL